MEVVFTVLHEVWVVVGSSGDVNKLLFTGAISNTEGDFSEGYELLVGAVSDTLGITTEVVDGMLLDKVGIVLINLLFSNEVVLDCWLD